MRLRDFTLIGTLLFSIILLGGCDKFPGASARSDGQVLDGVKARLNADDSVTNKQIEVGVKEGVVTLTGPVASETERLTAANDAATVPGVKTVVNNLQVQTAAAPVAPVPEPPVSRTAKPSPSSVRAWRPVKQTPVAKSDAPANVSAPSAAPAPPVQAAAPVSAPPKPPEPVRLTIPAGTRIAVRLDHALSSETNQAGDAFDGSLDAPLTDGDMVVFPAHTAVQGRVTDAKAAAKFKGSSLLSLELMSISYGGLTYDIATDRWTRQGTGRGKNTAAKVGGGAAVGALIGGLIGGGKGAAIGAGVGAGAGTTAQAVTKGEKVELPSETVLTFRLDSPLTVTVSPSTRKVARDSLPSDN